jgi:para-nitrobenzyl esterase
MTAQAALTAETPVPFTMVVDGHHLPVHPIDTIASGSAANVPLIIGSNSDENRLFRALGWGPGVLVGTFPERVAALFSSNLASRERSELVEEILGLYSTNAQDEDDLEEEFTNDRMWRAPIQELTNTYEDAGGTVFSYEFGFSSPVRGGEMRACHALEIPFVFGNLDQLGVNEFAGDNLGEGTEALAISRLMNAAWARFADCGIPSGLDLSEWSMRSKSGNEQLYISGVTTLRRDPHVLKTSWWNEHKNVMVPRIEL